MINATAFIKQLSTSSNFVIKPLILIHGEEPLYVQLALDGLRLQLKNNDYLQRDSFEVDGNFNWQELQQETATGNLFADRRIIELHAPTAKFGRQGGAFIQNWLKIVHGTFPEICIVIICEKIEFKQTKSKWFQAIETGGLVIQSRIIEGQNLITWCQTKAQDLGLSLEPEAALLLSQRVEGNLLAANQELEKLSLLFKGQTLNAQHINESVVDQAHYQLFALSNAMLNGKVEYSLQILNRLKQSGLEQPVILWLLSKELRELINLSQLQQTQPLEQVFKQLRIWQSRQAEYRAVLNRHGLAYLQSLLSIALAIDLNIKGIRQAQGYGKNDAWLGITDLVFKIARGRNR
jgi:DNA polymerase-3 subunit delta